MKLYDRCATVIGPVKRLPYRCNSESDEPHGGNSVLLPQTLFERKLSGVQDLALRHLIRSLPRVFLYLICSNILLYNNGI